MIHVSKWWCRDEWDQQTNEINALALQPEMFRFFLMMTLTQAVTSWKLQTKFSHSPMFMRLVVQHSPRLRIPFGNEYPGRVSPLALLVEIPIDIFH